MLGEEKVFLSTFHRCFRRNFNPVYFQMVSGGPDSQSQYSCKIGYSYWLHSHVPLRARFAQSEEVWNLEFISALKILQSQLDSCTERKSFHDRFLPLRSRKSWDSLLLWRTALIWTAKTNMTLKDSGQDLVLDSGLK